MARLKLDIEPDPEVSVIGISSHVRDHRLCWSINRALDMELTRRRTGIEEMQSGRPAEFTAFDQYDEETQANCTLVNNHSTEGVLLRDLRQADFFLVVDKDWREQPGEMLGKLRSAEFVLAAFPLSFTQLKEGHKLLL